MKSSSGSAAATATHDYTPGNSPTEALTLEVTGNGGVSMENTTSAYDEDTQIATVIVDQADLNKAFVDLSKNQNQEQILTMELTSLDQEINEFDISLPIETLDHTYADKALKLVTEIGTVLLPSDMLTPEMLRESPAGQAISFNMARVSEDVLDASLRQIINGRPIISLSLSVGGSPYVWINPDVPVQIAIPYTIQAGEDPEHIVIWYIDGQGKAIPVTNGRYNRDTGLVTFETTHFSDYAIAYVNKTFTDLSGTLWAKKEIEIFASKGIINGISTNAFGPNKNISRADFLVLLMKTLDLKKTFEDNFKDVSPTSYYYEAIGIAKAMGITSGSGNGNFNPKESISRQDMMVLTYKALLAKGWIEVDHTVQMADFSDRLAISSYAYEGVATLSSLGIVKGNNNMILPKGTTTRAEVAVILNRVYQLR